MNMAIPDRDQTNLQFMIFIFGIIEMSVGLGCVILSDFFSVFNTLTVLAGVMGVLALIFCITQPAAIKVYDVLGMALIFAYGTGTLNSLLSYALSHKDLIGSSFESEYWLSRALGFAAAGAGFLHVVGRFDQDGYIFKALDFSSLRSNRALWFVCGVTAYAFYMIAAGKLGFGGSTLVSQDSLSVSPTATIILALMTPVGAIALRLAILEKNRNMKVFLYAVSAVLLAIQFSFGRRVFLFSLILYLMMAIFTKRPRRFVTIKNLLICCLMGLLLQSAIIAMIAMRMATFTHKHDAKAPTIFQLIPEAYDVYQNRQRNYLLEKISENIESRTFVLEYLATLTRKTTDLEPMYGLNIYRAVIMAAPSIIYPSKFKSPYFGPEEYLANPHFRLPVWDAANTLFTAGVIDFGILGYFVLPVGLCLFYSMTLRLCSAFSSHSRFIVGLSLCQTLLFVEEDLGGYLAGWRTLIIILVITWLFFRKQEILTNYPQNLSVDVATKIGN